MSTAVYTRLFKFSGNKKRHCYLWPHQSLWAALDLPCFPEDAQRPWWRRRVCFSVVACPPQVSLRPLHFSLCFHSICKGEGKTMSPPSHKLLVVTSSWWPESLVVSLALTSCSTSCLGKPALPYSCSLPLNKCGGS